MEDIKDTRDAFSAPFLLQVNFKTISRDRGLGNIRRCRKCQANRDDIPHNEWVGIMYVCILMRQHRCICSSPL
jgi:hypothetical protein